MQPIIYCKGDNNELLFLTPLWSVKYTIESVLLYMLDKRKE